MRGCAEMSMSLLPSAYPVNLRVSVRLTADTRLCRIADDTSSCICAPIRIPTWVVAIAALVLSSPQEASRMSIWVCLAANVTGWRLPGARQPFPGPAAQSAVRQK
jgi:hypothetical protein